MFWKRKTRCRKYFITIGWNESRYSRRWIRDQAAAGCVGWQQRAVHSPGRCSQTSAAGGTLWTNIPLGQCPDRLWLCGLHLCRCKYRSLFEEKSICYNAVLCLKIWFTLHRRMPCTVLHLKSGLHNSQMSRLSAMAQEAMKYVLGVLYTFFGCHIQALILPRVKQVSSLPVCAG